MLIISLICTSTYMRGITYKNLASILDFIYNGEVNVAQEDLNSFLAIAEELQIKGLINDGNTNSIKNPEHSFSSNESKTRAGPRFSDRDQPPLKKIRKYKPDQMAITPVPKSIAKPFKVQNMVKDDPQTYEVLVQDILAAPDGTEQSRLTEMTSIAFMTMFNMI